MNAHRWLPLVVAGALLAATTAYAEDSADDSKDGKPALEERLAKSHYRIGEPVERIQNYRVDGWNYVDDEHIILTDGASRRYLVTLKIACIDLKSAETIGFTSTVTTLTKLDTLIVSSPIGPRRCPIDALHALEKQQDEEEG